jgi:hypothetical protein
MVMGRRLEMRRSLPEEAAESPTTPGIVVAASCELNDKSGSASSAPQSDSRCWVGKVARVLSVDILGLGRKRWRAFGVEDFGDIGGLAGREQIAMW